MVAIYAVSFIILDDLDENGVLKEKTKALETDSNHTSFCRTDAYFSRQIDIESVFSSNDQYRRIP